MLGVPAHDADRQEDGEHDAEKERRERCHSEDEGSGESALVD